MGMRPLSHMSPHPHMHRPWFGNSYCCREAVYHGLGMCNVLLTIKHPCTTKKPTAGWTSRMPCPTTPNGISCRIQRWLTQYAITPTIVNDMGIGVPSKYFDLPVLSLGRAETVTLKRASRRSPHITKNVRNRWSRAVRIPIANAAAAGAAPNEIWERDVCVSKGSACVRWQILAAEDASNVRDQPMNPALAPSDCFCPATLRPCRRRSQRTARRA